MEMTLSPERRTFVTRLYEEYRAHLSPESVAASQALDRQRIEATLRIRALADRVIAGELLPEDFRQESERVARQYNCFGFTGPNGQMFANQLVYAARDSDRSDELMTLLAKCLAVPADLGEASAFLDRMVAFVESVKQQVTKYGALAIWRLPFFLSYFWEAADRDRFPIAYPSTWDAIDRLGFVTRWSTAPSDAYVTAVSLIVQIRELTGMTTWGVERFLKWLADLPFAGIDPGDFERLQRNAELNTTYVPKVGYPDPEAAAEARANIDAVLKHLKALQTAIKPEIVKLFTGDVHPAMMAARKNIMDGSSSYGEEAWCYFLGRPWGWSEPSLHIGLTLEQVYWGFHFGISTKNPNHLRAQAERSFAEAEAAGARRYGLTFQAEPEEIAGLDRPYDQMNRGTLVGWVVSREDAALQLPSLAARIAADLSHFRGAVRALLEDVVPSPRPPGSDQPQATIELIGALREEIDAEDWIANRELMLARAGRLAIWWSFRIREAVLEELRDRTFYFNLYRRGGVFARMRVVDWAMDPEGKPLLCPWPAYPADGPTDQVAIGPARSEQFRLWLLVDDIERLQEPLGLGAFVVAGTELAPNPFQLRSSFAYVTRATIDRWEALARAIYRDTQFVLDLQQLLEERHQLIFYGPPGTGKTFVAQQFASTFTSPDRVRLIQFHPSYSYEEFVEGLHPEASGAGLSYPVRPGVLREVAEAAADQLDDNFVLVIDEINRANLSKVFGELFYLLEYRDAEIRLPYSGEPFSLPPNLYLIGTMNTSDRSIALVDFALRRRFGFVPFYPDENLTELRRYLREKAKEEYLYVADMLVEVNRNIRDPDFHLGHSYFMLPDPGSLTQERIERIWRFSILPYLKEYWYDQRVDLKEYEFAALSQRVQRADASIGQTDILAEPSANPTSGPVEPPS